MSELVMARNLCLVSSRRASKMTTTHEIDRLLYLSIDTLSHAAQLRGTEAGT